MVESWLGIIKNNLRLLEIKIAMLINLNSLQAKLRASRQKKLPHYERNLFV